MMLASHCSRDSAWDVPCRDRNVRVFELSEPRASHERQFPSGGDEDSVLVHRAREGDHAAFRQLVERHQSKAHAIALRFVRDEDDARDVVQEAFLRVYRGLARFQGGSSFFTWFYRIVANAAIDLKRKPARRESPFDDARPRPDEVYTPFLSRLEGADPADAVARRELSSRIQKALDELPPYHRGAIVMRELEGLSYEEMAQAMGVSKGTVMSRLFHARQKLQRALLGCHRERFSSPAARWLETSGGSGGGTLGLT